jgi:predicted DNA-binding ArsR family transcriptional regulator
MTEKRFELQINKNGQADIIDWVESKEKNAICIYNDLGVLPYSSAKALCELLNQLYDENEQIKQDNDNLIHLLENQSMIIQELHSKLMHYQLKEPIVLTKEDLEVMGKAISYYSH